MDAKSSNFFPLLALMFIYLKLTGVIEWSWLWVLAPLWGSLAVVAALSLLLVLVAAYEKASRRVKP